MFFFHKYLNINSSFKLKFQGISSSTLGILTKKIHFNMKTDCIHGMQQVTYIKVIRRCSIKKGVLKHFEKLTGVNRVLI